MWFFIAGAMWLHIQVTDVDHDGVHNYLLQSQEYPRPVSISFSTDEPLPHKEGEWFVGRVEMKCQEMWTLHNDKGTERIGQWGTPGRAYICNAKSLKTDKGVFQLSDKRRGFYEGEDR